MRQRKNKLVFSISMVLVLLTAAALFLLFDKPSGGSPQGSNYTDPNAVFRAGDDNSQAAIGEHAWFYYEGNLVKYYDPALKKNFILCSRSNCRHKDKGCAAYFGDDGFGESAIQGIVSEGDYVYVLSSGEGSIDMDRPVSYQIVRIDPSDGTRRVIAEFNNSIYAKPDDGLDYFAFLDPVNIYVCNGLMWFKDQMMMTPGKTLEDEPLQWRTNIGIDLKTGKTTVIGSKDNECRILTMGSGYVTYVHDEYNEPVLTQKEFYDRLTADGKVEYAGSSYNDYTAYVNSVKNNSGVTSKYYLYHLNDKTTEKLFESKTVPVHLSRDPSSVYHDAQKTIFGSHNDLLLIREWLPDDNGEYSQRHFSASLYNIEDGSSKQFFETENGHLPSTMIDSLNGILADGSVIIYQYSKDGTKTEDWVYNVDTNELKYIYTKQDLGYSFRPEGIWNEGFIGTVWQLSGILEGANDDYYPMSYAWISREDYLSGNMKALVKYKIK